MLAARKSLQRCSSSKSPKICGRKISTKNEPCDIFSLPSVFFVLDVLPFKILAVSFASIDVTINLEVYERIMFT